MPGTKIGGVKARETNIQRHGKDYYARIGAMGGKKSGTGGFYHSKVTGANWHVEAGRKGGKISRKGKANVSN